MNDFMTHMRSPSPDAPIWPAPAFTPTNTLAQEQQSQPSSSSNRSAGFQTGPAHSSSNSLAASQQNNPLSTGVSGHNDHTQEPSWGGKANQAATGQKSTPVAAAVVPAQQGGTTAQQAPATAQPAQPTAPPAPVADALPDLSTAQSSKQAGDAAQIDVETDKVKSDASTSPIRMPIGIRTGDSSTQTPRGRASQKHMSHSPPGVTPLAQKHSLSAYAVPNEDHGAPTSQMRMQQPFPGTSRINSPVQWRSALSTDAAPPGFPPSAKGPLTEVDRLQMHMAPISGRFVEQSMPELRQAPGTLLGNGASRSALQLQPAMHPVQSAAHQTSPAAYQMPSAAQQLQSAAYQPQPDALQRPASGMQMPSDWQTVAPLHAASVTRASSTDAVAMQPHSDTLASSQTSTAMHQHAQHATAATGQLQSDHEDKCVPDSALCTPLSAEPMRALQQGVTANQGGSDHQNETAAEATRNPWQSQAHHAATSSSLQHDSLQLVAQLGDGAQQGSTVQAQHSASLHGLAADMPSGTHARPHDQIYVSTAAVPSYESDDRLAFSSVPVSQQQPWLLSQPADRLQPTSVHQHWPNHAVHWSNSMTSTQQGPPQSFVRSAAAFPYTQQQQQQQQHFAVDSSSVLPPATSYSRHHFTPGNVQQQLPRHHQIPSSPSSGVYSPVNWSLQGRPASISKYAGKYTCTCLR